MEEQKNVKTIHELEGAVRMAVEDLAVHYIDYDASRSPVATQEERFNEGRHGRAMLASIDEAMKALTTLRMRVHLQVEGRDSARAHQLDRILGMSEEDTKLVDAMLDIAKKVVDGQRDDGGGTT